MNTQMRAWDKENKIMGYLDHSFDENWYTYPSVYGNYPVGVAFTNEWKGKGRPENYIIMLCSGEEDKYNNNIYDGDIIKCVDSEDEEYITTVKYDDGAFIVNVHGCDWDYTAIGWAMINDIRDVEVIGNSYQNPELLEKCE
jgi:uncharacterized phage protein (TIGR01671 family)